MSAGGQEPITGMPPEVVILIGAPGSGKTAIGNELSSKFGYRYTDHEAELVAKYGPLETFVNHKKQAISEVHDAIVAAISEGGAPLVVETTALSERVFIDGLIRGHRSFTVRLDVPLETGIERIESRPRARNLSNNAGTARLIWERFMETHEQREFDLRLDTGQISVSEAARLIDSAVRNSP